MVVGRGPASVFAVVLAAGTSSRFGSTKQLAVLHGETLVKRVANVACEVCEPRTVLVVGHDGTAVADAVKCIAQFLVVNEHNEDGIGSSIAVAVKAIAHAADAILLLLADQPLVTAAHLELLIETWGGGDSIVATSFADTQGPPVLFPRAAFDALAGLSGDAGAKSVLNSRKFNVKAVAFDDAAIDIDTPEDLASLRDRNSGE